MYNDTMGLSFDEGFCLKCPVTTVLTDAANQKWVCFITLAWLIIKNNPFSHLKHLLSLRGSRGEPGPMKLGESPDHHRYYMYCTFHFIYFPHTFVFPCSSSLFKTCSSLFMYWSIVTPLFWSIIILECNKSDYKTHCTTVCRLWYISHQICSI